MPVAETVDFAYCLWAQRTKWACAFRRDNTSIWRRKAHSFHEALCCLRGSTCPGFASAQEGKATAAGPISHLGESVHVSLGCFSFSATWDNSRILNAGAVSGSQHPKIASSSQEKESEESVFQNAGSPSPLHVDHAYCITSYILPLL